MYLKDVPVNETCIVTTLTGESGTIRVVQAGWNTNITNRFPSQTKSTVKDIPVLNMKHGNIVLLPPNTRVYQ